MEKVQRGNETIEVPDIVAAQGRAAVAEFVNLPGTQRQERLNRLLQAHQAKQKEVADAAAAAASKRAEGLRDEQVSLGSQKPRGKKRAAKPPSPQMPIATSSRI